MSTLTKENSSGKGLRIFAGILFIAYVMFNIFQNVLSMFLYRSTFLYGDLLIDITRIIYYIAPLVIAVFLFIKKSSIPVTIALGAMLTAELYWFIYNLPFVWQHCFENFWDTFDSLNCLTAPLLILCTFIFSLVSLINERNKFVKLWFIPLILAIFDITLRFVEVFFFAITYNETISISDLILLFVNITYNLSFLFYCIAVAKGVPNTPISAINQPAPPIQSYQPPVYTSPAFPETGQSYPITDTDELRKYKAMLDEGLITQQDYDRKKNEIIGL